jgi:hypothetical protein
MFGLMRSRSCALGPDEKLRRRLHYCGTCKSIGSRYGQSARLLLNFDSVFAAEVLTAVAGIDAPDNWDRNFHSVNCFRLPSEDAIPEPVRYAAAMTVVLAEVKVADHIDDGRGIVWRAFRRGMSPGFRQASVDLAERWGFPVDELWAHVRKQAEVERTALAGIALSRNPESVLRDCAEPTARATALAFSHAAVAISRPDAAASLHKLGSHFGRVIYILDAIRDVAEDARAGTFNAVTAAFGVKSERLPADVRRAAVRVLRSAQSDLETAIARLPISAERAALFIDRLRSNVDRAVGSRRLPVHSSSPIPEPAITRVRGRISVSTRVREALSIARAASLRHFASCKPLPIRVAEAPFVFALALVAAVVAPVAVASATSPREMLDALMNVAAIGGTLSMAMPPIGPGMDPTEQLRRRAQQGQPGADTGESTAECCCDCCDCCSSGDSSCGSCDACNCCGDGSCCSGCGDCGNCCHCSNSCGDCDCGDCCSCDCS